MTVPFLTRSNWFPLCSILFLCFCPLCRTSSAFTTCPIRRNRLSGSTWSSRSDYRLESSANDVWSILDQAIVLDPMSERQSTALDGVTQKGFVNFFESVTAMVGTNSKPGNEEFVLVVVMPQLGDFDSAEYDDANAAKRFANFSGLDLESIRVDPTGELHRSLGLHSGPNWDVPSFVSKGFLDWFSDYVGVEDDRQRDSKAIFRSWLNYMAMCAGIASPDTLPEILRGYIGDKNSPERLRFDEIVTVGGTISGNNGEDTRDPFIAITGTTDVKLGPFKYQQAWKNESGYQRPLELATVRLRIMVEVLSNFAEYVPDQRYLDLRGATYLFRRADETNGNKNDSVTLVYEHIDTGVLSYSKTMGRPLSFLESYVGKTALNPLGLGDNAGDQ
eukprot:CAMPEP_0168283426 /NCGR_PEP_ID=MMETSP0141_2-20121125/22939_1 /TAXON_ID=44445 /ORGANISM="Pseudo-nitzschia australis, Strain 10249 10 AB" /LENGTH=388 /DNA_ID=CAMNT_0008227307 /DNA_START=198 /DNA_END=1362 /DNA_ORIENTATION=+